MAKIEKSVSTSSDNVSAKSRRFNYFCAVVFVLAFIILFAFNGKQLYAESFVQVKSGIENRFAVFPHYKIELGLKQVFRRYMWLTNRKGINDTVVMNDGRLTTRQDDSPVFLEEKIEIIASLNDYLEKKGVPFLFVRAPDKMQDASLLPIGYTSSIIEDGALFVSMLNENGIDTLDLREEMMNENMDFATAFYRGDHHWTAETALWACGKIGSLLNSDYGFKLDESLWNPQSYKAITYEKAFMGSESIRIGDSKLEEDITVLIPTFHTEFEVREVSAGENTEIVASGDFAEVFVPKSKTEQDGSFGYSDLNIADRGFTQYNNLTAREHKKILLIADSFGRALSPYLACSLEQIDYLRLGDDHNKKLYSVLENEKFDMVIFLIYDYVIVSDNENSGKGRMNLGKPPR